MTPVNFTICIVRIRLSNIWDKYDKANAEQLGPCMKLSLCLFHSLCSEFFSVTHDFFFCFVFFTCYFRSLTMS